MNSNRDELMSKRTTRNLQRAGKANADSARMAAEIPLAAVSVLGYRLPMLTAAAADPKRRNAVEEQRMVSEKVAAGMTAGASLVNGGVRAIDASLRGWQSVGLSWLSLVLTGAPGSPSRAASRSIAQAQRVANLSLANSAEAARALSEGVRGAVIPVHGKVTANARRLSRRGGKAG
jgi:hypothetical protein